MRVLVNINQKAAIAAGINAPRSTETIEVDPAEIPEECRALFADWYNLNTGRVSPHHGPEWSVVPPDLKGAWLDGLAAAVAAEKEREATARKEREAKEAEAQALATDIRSNPEKYIVESNADCSVLLEIGEITLRLKLKAKAKEFNLPYQARTDLVGEDWINGVREELRAENARSKEAAIAYAKEEFLSKHGALIQLWREGCASISPLLLEKFKAGYAEANEVHKAFWRGVKERAGLELLSCASVLVLDSEYTHWKSSPENLTDKQYAELVRIQKRVLSDFPGAQFEVGLASKGSVFRPATEDDDPEEIDSDNEVYDPEAVEAINAVKVVLVPKGITLSIAGYYLDPLPNIKLPL